MFLMKLNENGPTASPPADWATKANPHIAAVSSNMREYFMVLFIYKPLIIMLRGSH